jgi:branched-chain amino acid transport system permease protein
MSGLVLRFFRLFLRLLPWLRPVLAPVALPLVGVGGLVLSISTFLAWADYPGFPGLMSNAGSPGGARLYVLLLALPVLLVLRPVPGRAAALRAASWVALSLTLLTLFFIAYAAGGIVNVGSGIFVAVIGAVLYLLGAQGLSTEVEPPAPAVTLPNARWRGPLEWLLVLGVSGLGLLVFVVGLGMRTSDIAQDPDTRILNKAISLNDVTNQGQFLSFIILVAGLAAVAARLGVAKGVAEINQRYPKLLVSGALMAATSFPFTQNGSGYSLRIAASIGVFAAAAVGLNIVVGLAGLLDLGYIAFFGVGAYFAAIFSGSLTSVIHVRLPFYVVIVLGAAVAGLFGLLLGAPTLRLRGDYLAIVTLGFGEIFRITVNNLDGTAGPSLTNGPNGVSNVPDLAIGSFNFGDNHTLFGVVLSFQANYFWLEIIVVAVVMTAFLRLSESRIGRAWVAIREDELAAAATGINTTRFKLLAFTLGAMLAGVAGTVDAHVVKVATPDSFTFIESATLLAAIILGGMGTVPGALLGATVLYLLPEQLRFLKDIRLLVFGIVLVLIMRFRPEGLIPSKRRAREFHENEHRPDALDAPPGHSGALG